MANKKISELTAASAPLSGSELVELVQGGVNVKATAQDIADLASGGVSSVNGETGAVTLVASDIPSTAFGSIAATNVQAALEEIVAEASGSVSSVDTLTGAVSLQSLSAVAVSAGALTLAWGSRQTQNFDLTTTLSSNITVTLTGSNKVNGLLFLRVTGTVVLTFAAGTYMDLYEKSVGRWDTTGTRQLQLIGVTASPFMLEFKIDASGNVLVWASNRMVTS